MSREIHVLKEGAKQVPREEHPVRRRCSSYTKMAPVPGVEQARGGGMGEVDDTGDWRTQVSTRDFTP